VKDSLITLIFFIWVVFGALFMVAISESVKKKQVVFYKRFLVCLVCGPAVWCFAGMPATYGALVGWLKR